MRGIPNALNELSCDAAGAGAWAAKRACVVVRAATQTSVLTRATSKQLVVHFLPKTSHLQMTRPNHSTELD